MLKVHDIYMYTYLKVGGAFCTVHHLQSSLSLNDLGEACDHIEAFGPLSPTNNMHYCLVGLVCRGETLGYSLMDV